MTNYKVTAATWNGHDEGSVVADPDISQADLDVLVKIGVLAPVDSPVTPLTTQEAEVPNNGDLSQ